MTEALEHVAESSRAVFEERLELLKLEARLMATRSARGGALLAVAAVLGAGAWFGLMGALVAWLSWALPLAVALGGVAAANALLAAVLAWRGATRLRDPLPAPEPNP